jgi:hypothetical protein
MPIRLDDFTNSHHEPLNRAGLVEAIALHGEVEVAVVLDGVAVGVEQGGVPVAEGHVSLGAVEWETDVAACYVEFGVLSAHDDHRCFGVWAVVAGACLGHVDDSGVVEHCAVALGDGLELGDEGIDLLHMVSFDDVSHLC